MTIRSTRSQVHRNDMTTLEMLLIIRNQHFYALFLSFDFISSFLSCRSILSFCYYYLLSLSLPLFLSVIIFCTCCSTYMCMHIEIIICIQRGHDYTVIFIFFKAYITSLLFSLLILLFCTYILTNNLKNSGNVVFTYILSMK